MSEQPVNASLDQSTPEQSGKFNERWAEDLIARVAFASLLEQRRTRRWGIFFKFLIFIYFLAC